MDPCVGPGIFVNSLLDRNIEPSQIYAYDINPDYKNEIEGLGVNFKVLDTLLGLYPDSYKEFDFIVGNPPYLNKY